MQPKTQQSLVAPPPAPLWGAQGQQDSTTAGAYSSRHMGRH